MIGGMDDPFADIENEAKEAILESRMRSYERLYFSDVKEVECLRVVPIPGPACLSHDRIIKINPAVAIWPKTASILILHELIHNFLEQKNGNRDPDEGEQFQTQVRRLWEASAYEKLL
jgi:hypothetical protein